LRWRIQAAVEGEIMIGVAEDIELLPLWEFIIEPNYGSILRRVPCYLNWIS